jgi:hypothetical protein
MAELEVVTNADRPDLGEQHTTVFRPVWPEFIFHDPIDARYANRVETYFPQYSVLLLDGTDIVTGGWGVPIPVERYGRRPTGRLRRCACACCKWS